MGKNEVAAAGDKWLDEAIEKNLFRNGGTCVFVRRFEMV